MFPSTRSLRASCLILLSLSLSACAIAEPVPRLPDPHVTMLDGRLRGAALACAARGYGWVARTGPHSAYCLLVNPDNEPEAVDVSSLINGAP